MLTFNLWMSLKTGHLIGGFSFSKEASFIILIESFQESVGISEIPMFANYMC